jgi:DNA-binding XRE family transcriptional regulator
MNLHIVYGVLMTQTLRDTSAPQETARRQVRQNGKAIQSLREKDGFTQTAFAREIGMTQANLWRIENERANARVATLNKIARKLCVHVGAIMREDYEAAA